MCYRETEERKKESAVPIFLLLFDVMIRLSAPGCLFTFDTSREGTCSRLGAYSGQGAYFFFEKQLNVQNRKGNSNRNCISNRYTVNVQLT